MKCVSIIFICILGVLFGSCSNPLLINGTYGGKHNPHVFVFSEDSTFKYEYRAVWYSESSGIWERRENTIYLNSFEQRDKMPLKYTKTINNQKKVIISIRMNVLDKLEGDYICFPYVNGKSTFENPEKGSYFFDSAVPVDSIYFLIAKRPFVLRGTGYKMSYDDVRTETIYPHLSVGENLNVTINIIDSLFGYKVFKNEKLELKNRKILFKEKGKNYKLYLKR